jgi:hypothetical protein
MIRAAAAGGDTGSVTGKKKWLFAFFSGQILAFFIALASLPSGFSV